ncbi:hypothetical protein HYALB_00006867 [Hymenoscyphus albidus]|uniref:CipC-like antibiotic response protein n=1 Tax=Hymenoscyphus albidus TaxID=595503 RepID=A0A9N9LGK8_9HELO|nr:hypothetical protein HYALB_00006867 [Hymenoscyphus albidus]
MPFGWNEAQDAHRQYSDQETHNESSFGHELLAGAASFGAFKVFEDRQRAEGKPVSHAFAKELLAGFAGAEVDKLAETKGLDYIDREKAKRHASENVEHMYDEHYVRGQRAGEYDPNRYKAPQAIQRREW